MFDGTTRERKWITYLGETERCYPTCVTIDDLHNLYVAGYTSDPNFLLCN